MVYKFVWQHRSCRPWHEKLTVHVSPELALFLLLQYWRERGREGDGLCYFVDWSVLLLSMGCTFEYAAWPPKRYQIINIVGNVSGVTLQQRVSAS